MYELGIAHNKDKPVILLTQDPSSNVPSDIKHIEHIHYDLNNHVSFLSNLKNALMGIYIETYTFLYNKAIEYYKNFKEKVSNAESIPFEEFCNLINNTHYDLSQMKEDRFALPFLLPKIIKNSDDIDMMTNIVNFVNDKNSNDDMKEGSNLH